MKPKPIKKTTIRPTSKHRRLQIYDAILSEVRQIGRRQILQGVDAGDPVAQIRACCNVIEAQFEDHLMENALRKTKAAY